MTIDDLANDYFRRSKIRLKALKTLLDEGGYPDVIREGQEIVELVLKGYLRLKKIDPPKWHDVAKILKENDEILSEKIKKNLNEIIDFSHYLRRERESSFYGEEDLIPLEHYNEKTAKNCYQKVKWLLDLFKEEFLSETE